MTSCHKSVQSFIWALCLMAGSTFAQSSLPACQDSDFTRWTNCFGTYSGTYPFANGDRYVGEFKDGKRHGQGTLTFVNGNKYVGEFKGSYFNGQGTFTYTDGDKYVSGFKDGQRSGPGIQYKADGTVISSNWKSGHLIDSVALEINRFPFNAPTQAASAQPSAPEKVQLAAAAQSQLPVCSFPVGQKWTDCFGTQIFSNGSMYVGEFKDGSFNGQGMEYYPNGSIRRQGRWENGNLVQSFAVDTQRFPFNAPIQTAQSSRAEIDRINAEAQAARQRQQDLEQRLTLQTAEAEAAKRRQQELEAQLAAAQSTAQALPTAVSIRSAHALVIGNAAYPGSGRLDNPVNDANAISQKLRSMGFTVTMVTDANRQRLVQAMAQFRRSAASADLSLLFYSGHGVQIFGTNYILPTDVDQTDTAQATIQGVRLNEVIGNFMPGKTKIVFLDACRDNPLQRTGDRSVTKGLAPISVAEGTLISYATKDGQTAADGVGSKNSPFTQALLEHLSDPQDIGVVLRKVREKVMRATGGKQQPWEYGSLTGGELVLSKIKGGR